ncbi:hypothetical protein BHE74_00037580 [Ensete ventricosum]|nr:hypothetical protein BHE74_00037580 [Ensete ventricosum]
MRSFGRLGMVMNTPLSAYKPLHEYRILRVSNSPHIYEFYITLSVVAQHIPLCTVSSFIKRPTYLEHRQVWLPTVGILAFHQALVRQPRDPLVVAIFTLALHNGGNLSEAVDIAEKIAHSHDGSYSELLEPQKWDAEGHLVSDVIDLASSVASALSSMTDEHFVSQAMARYPQAPYSDLVSITRSWK